jgi:ATP-dependent Lon protease
MYRKVTGKEEPYKFNDELIPSYLRNEIDEDTEKMIIEQKTIVESLKQMHDHYKTDEHPYFRILRLPIDAESKRNALEKQMQIMKNDQMGYEDSTNNKLQSWLHSFLKLPFGLYTKFPKTARQHPAKYLLKASQTLDKEVYGMDDAKDHLLRYVAHMLCCRAQCAHL